MGKGGGLLGGVNQALFGDGGAGAAEAAAMAQQGTARRLYNEQKGLGESATKFGIAHMDKSIAMQEKNLARQEQLISQIDPTIIEASQQALRLLRGESSSALAPLQKQRDMQRQKMLNSLREQLGPGAETSTAGIQALTRFDSESGNLFASAQQQALGNMGNIYGQFSAGKPNMGGEIGSLAQMGLGRSGLQFQQAENLRGAGQGLMSTAGAQYTGEMMRGQSNQAFGQALLGAAAQGGGMYLGKKLMG